MAKRAQLIAAAIAVICPHCNEPIGAPDNGSDLWEPQQIQDRRGKPGTCTACSKQYYLPSIIGRVRMP